MDRLKDKIVLITGAAGAVGRAVMAAAKVEGATVITSVLPGRAGAMHALDVTSELDWLRVIAEWNPVSSLAQAMRELWGNGPAAPASAPEAPRAPPSSDLPR